MYEEICLIGLALWLGLPAWIANSTPVIFGGGRPIDGGKMFRDGSRLLGDGKTIRGFVAGIFWGTLTGAILVYAAPYVKSEMVNYLTVTSDMDVILNMPLLVGFMLSVGALTGDLVGSFLKRRVGLRSGAPSPVLDQLGFVLMALIFAAMFLDPNPFYPAVLIIVTFGIHLLSNTLGYLIGVKKNPW